MAFSTAGTTTTRFNGSLAVTAATKVPMTLAPPHMSYFISSMPPWVFRLTPPVSKVMPLPTSTYGLASPPLLHFSTTRRGRLAEPRATASSEPMPSASIWCSSRISASAPAWAWAKATEDSAR